MSYEFFRAAIQEAITNDKKECEAHGYPFKPRDPDLHTIGDIVRATLTIKTEADARRFYEGQIDWLLKRFKEKFKGNREEAAVVARSNIGWCFGEGMGQDRIDMWNRTTKAFHPGFGTQIPTPAEAFAAGKAMGEAARAKRHA